MFLDLQEVLWLNACLLQNGAKGPFRHVAGVIRNGRVPVDSGVEPDLVAACGLSVKLEPMGSQLACDLPISKTRETPHQAAITIV